ncbi:MAG: LolA-like outer membrane lipoprotein chaperone [Sulfurimonadaceae bacterium]|jgi:outer membrane lipoprotein carrier protein|nr:LolA-like outer membrane lipoprotein chaperone [Sulfurimonadaceae bacterium]
MKLFLFLTTFLLLNANASSLNIDSFQAEFIQTITDEKAKVLTYTGSVVASKPKYALWKYTTPFTKEIYINQNQVIVIEPEIEQVIFKRIDTNLDFLQIMQHAKEIAPNQYKAVFQNVVYIINLKNNKIDSIAYKDNFDNAIAITFSKQKENQKIDEALFKPKIPLDFDIISE